MTNEIYAVGLTRMELRTLEVLLPMTFSVIPFDAKQLHEESIEKLSEQGRCIFINPKRISADFLAYFLRIQESCRNGNRPIPMLLLTDTLTREQRRLLPHCELPVISLRKRMDRNRSHAVKLLRETSFPCWQNRSAMAANMFNDGWYLIEIETTGRDIWNDNITCIHVALIANYEITGGDPPIYIRQPAASSSQTGVTTEGTELSLEEAVDYLESLRCSDTPFVFENEAYTAGFLHAAYLRCGKAFTRPYLAIDTLANIPFGYLLERHAKTIPSRIGAEPIKNYAYSDQLQALGTLTKCVFENLILRYGVRCPATLDRLYAAEIIE